ncbi:mediator of RNA polymerase II transcription subunit 28 [Egretta garzetta]|uniref:mediator of RNA polymerase II transcription subunit 28 n=1 Tax=Egretta garzetta TaxID=188379 RepID=UPI00163D3141|nr:mediator of RNA polymerase II transcription subunit 28 [Egretta garzetta]
MKKNSMTGSASVCPASPETREALQVYLGFAAGVRAVSLEAERGLKTLPGSLLGAPGVTRGCSPLARQDAVLRPIVLPCRKIRGSKTREPTWCITELHEGVIKGVDQCIQKFLDVARQTECFFLQKRLQLSVQKPEQVIKEDVSELRNELQRKEALIQKHLGKLRHWQQVLEDISVQHKKPAEMPQGPLAYLEQASANIPAPMKQT